MEASRWVETFRRFLGRLLGTPTERRPSRSVPRVVASKEGPVAVRAPVAKPLVVAPAEEARVDAPVPVKSQTAAPAVAPPLFVQELMQPLLRPAPEDPPAAIKPMRSLEEVRADLARLRASAKERHAQAQAQAHEKAQARRNVAFEPTDFLDFETPEAPPSDNPESSFASTAYLDFTTLKPRGST
jgi:hypothetical protein